MPLSTLHARPYGRSYMTQGRCDWLGLHRTTLAFATPHRFIPALLPLLLGPLMASPFNIVIAGRAARTSTHDRRSRIRCLEAVLWCDRIEIGRGNVSTHVESPAPYGCASLLSFSWMASKIHVRRGIFTGLDLAAWSTCSNIAAGTF